MKQFLIATCAALLLTVAPAAYGSVLLSLNSTFMDTTYDSATGVLTISDAADIVVEYDDIGQVTYTGGSFVLTATLDTNLSAGGIAAGLFTGGTLTVKDGGGADLLLADSVDLNLAEWLDGTGFLTAAGTFNPTGGLFEPDFDIAGGKLANLTFGVDPTIGDLATDDFDGQTNVTAMPVTPVPEPATMAVVGLGLAGIAFARKRR